MNKMKNKIENFFNAILGPESPEEHQVEIRCKRGEYMNSHFFPLYTDAAAFTLEQEEGTNVYFGVAGRKINAQNGRKENCHHLASLFCDVDYGNDGHKGKQKLKNKDEALRVIDRFGLEPHIIVSSGHGFHCYWKLQEPVLLNQGTIPDIERRLKKIIINLNGDKGTQDVSRILRVPYTKNYKKGQETVDVNILKEKE